MDKSVCRSFKHHWSQELIQFISQHLECKTSFNVIFSQVWQNVWLLPVFTTDFTLQGYIHIIQILFLKRRLRPRVVWTTNSENIDVLSNESGKQEISNVNVEHSDGSGTELRIVTVLVVKKLKFEYWINHNQWTTCEMNYRAEQIQYPIKSRRY